MNQETPSTPKEVQADALLTQLLDEYYLAVATIKTNLQLSSRRGTQRVNSEELDRSTLAAITKKQEIINQVTSDSELSAALIKRNESLE